MLIPFKVGHIAGIDLEEKAAETVARPEMAAALDWLERTGNGKTIASANGRIMLGVMGLVPLIEGVCEVFVVASKDQKQHPATFARTVKKELLELRPKFRRIQAIAKNDAFHDRWLFWLGFEKEGILKKYDFDGSDMAMWGLTKD